MCFRLLIFLLVVGIAFPFKNYAEEPVLLEGLEVKKPPTISQRKKPSSKMAQQKKPQRPVSDSVMVDKSNPIIFGRAEIMITPPTKPQIKQEIDPKSPPPPPPLESKREGVKLDVEIRYADAVFRPDMIEQIAFGDKQGLLVILNRLDAVMLDFSPLYISRDMVLIDDKNIITEILPHVKPQSTEPMLSNYATLSILELNAGMAKAYDIQVGDVIQIIRK